MNEPEFAVKLATHLSAAAHELDDELAQRLHAARERALAAQGRPGRLARFFSVGGAPLAFSPALRSAAAMLALVLAVIVGDYRATWERVSTLQEVDTALLIDDLPIDAYLDTEFRAWLQRESHS